MKIHKSVEHFSDDGGVHVAFSSVDDGSMAAGGGKPLRPLHQMNAERFLKNNNFTPDGRTTVFVTYTPENTYKYVARVTDENSGSSIACDALYTTEKNKVITLPVADCVATIVYDPCTHLLGVLHLGRHASVSGLIEEFAIKVQSTVDSNPKNWQIWMSPSLRKEYDIMEYFEPPHPEHWQDFQYTDEEGNLHIDVIGHNRDRFEKLGVLPENIFVSPEDTYSDERYFSHRASKELARPDRQGRMLVAAVMTD